MGRIQYRYRDGDGDGDGDGQYRRVFASR